MRCDTKYPLLLVHGVGFHDWKAFNYWGRIPRALQEQGAVILYGEQDSWATVEYNADILKNNLNKYLAELKCQKVNIIAHSKGGLESRYIISSLGMARNVASLTTVATPHHGSKTIDLICKLPRCSLKFAGVFVNAYFRLLGDKKPDFFAVIHGLKTASMREFNAKNPDCPDIYYQSYAAVMKNPFSDMIMCAPNFIVGLTEGENDGLVSAASAEWTNFKGVLRNASRRGVSHKDVVDFSRRPLAKKKQNNAVTDIRDFYIEMVAGLKDMGF